MFEPRLNSSTIIRSNPQLVSILSGKGGVGKSIITFNLGERLAAEGYRVLIVDADTQCGNLHILANLVPRYGVSDFAYGRLKLKDATLPVNNLLDMLAAPLSMEIDQQAHPFELVDLVRSLRREGTDYDLILLDHASGVSEKITESAALTDAQALILVPELTSIADAYGLFKKLTQEASHTNCLLLVNRSESEREAEHLAGKFIALADRFVGRLPGFIGSLSQSEDVRQAVARQQALAEIAPQAPELQEIRNIARRLVERLTLDQNLSPVHQNGRINIQSVTADIEG